MPFYLCANSQCKGQGRNTNYCYWAGYKYDLGMRTDRTKLNQVCSNLVFKVIQCLVFKDYNCLSFLFYFYGTMYNIKSKCHHFMHCTRVSSKLSLILILEVWYLQLKSGHWHTRIRWDVIQRPSDYVKSTVSPRPHSYILHHPSIIPFSVFMLAGSQQGLGQSQGTPCTGCWSVTGLIYRDIQPFTHI